ncbi:hypothetical protein APUTEX25_004085, partial [Auxenochlorella protothecoides]
ELPTGLSRSMSGAEDLNTMEPVHEAHATSPALMTVRSLLIYVMLAHACFLREDDFQEGEAARELPLSTSVVLAGSVDGEGSDTVVPVNPEDHASTPSMDGLIAAEPEDGESGRSMVEVSPCISSLATDGAASEQASDSDSHFTNELIAAGEPEECPVTPMLSQGASPAASEAGADPEIQPVQPIPSVEPVPSAYPAPLLTRVCMAAASELVTLTRQRTLTRHHAVRAVPIIAHASCSWHGVATAGASL